MTTTYEPNVVLSQVEYDVVGTRPIRHDGADKVTGRAKYGADVHSTGMLYGYILRSPHAHANIRSIDTSKAEALSSVRAVVTAADFPETPLGDDGSRKVTLGELSTDLLYLRDGIMARKKVVFRGHPVAAVAATSAHDAEQAAKLIEVDYEVLEPVSEVVAAMADDAPILHDDLEMTEFGENTGRKGNIADHSQNKKGDPAKGFEEADVIVEREFNTATVHQGYIEPHTCTVHWRDDGRIHIWNSTQGPFNVRDATAQVLDVPLTQVKLTPQEIGGGFGGKFEPYGEPVMAVLSKKTGHPVKMAMSRADEFEATGPTPGSYIKVKMGATKEGKLVAGEAYCWRSRREPTPAPRSGRARNASSRRTTSRTQWSMPTTWFSTSPRPRHTAPPARRTPSSRPRRWSTRSPSSSASTPSSSGC